MQLALTGLLLSDDVFQVGGVVLDAMGLLTSQFRFQGIVLKFAAGL